MEQRIPSLQPGRRSGDFLTKVGKVLAVLLSAVALLAMTGNVFLKSQQIELNRSGIVSLTQRVTVVEQQQHDMFYMTCVMFQKVKPEDVPASCDIAVRPSR